jgi:hypothetical protein
MNTCQNLLPDSKFHHSQKVNCALKQLELRKNSQFFIILMRRVIPIHLTF